MIEEVLCIFAILIATDTIKRGIPENGLSPKTFLVFYHQLDIGSIQSLPNTFRYVIQFPPWDQFEPQAALGGTEGNPAVMNSFAVQLADCLIETI